MDECPNIALFRRIIAEGDERMRAAGVEPTVLTQAQKDALEAASPAFAEAMRFLRNMGDPNPNPQPAAAERTQKEMAEALLDEALGPNHAAFVLHVPSNMQ